VDRPFNIAMTVFSICKLAFFLMLCLFEQQLVLSSLLVWRECQISPSTRMTTEWKSVRLYVVPSIIYLIHNNVQFATLTYVDASTYQIMGNLKIVTTGILFRCLFYTVLFYHSLPRLDVFWNEFSLVSAN